MAEEKIDASERLVIIGGSAGSLEVLLTILPRLDNNFRVPVLIILHRTNEFESRLTDIFSARTSFQIREVEEKDEIRPGTIYVAPIDYHVLVEKNKIFSLDFSEKVNYSRPSIDVTFASAAEVYRGNLVCILLSGANADGAEGMAAAGSRGSITIVQDPQTATISYMPQHAINTSEVNFIYNSREIADFLNGLSG